MQDDTSPSESARLAALHRYGVLDTAPEEAFDRIVALAQTLFDTPIALISLIDESRQWFKAKLGLDAVETPREWAFCAYAIQQEAVTVIPDATLDPRVASNPLVTADPHIRFYAGAPLRTPDGHVLGTVCVIAPEPRQFSERDRERLAALAGIAMNELELKRQLYVARSLAVEKDLLMREMHHRVHNSLQMVGNVLRLQSRRSESAEVQGALDGALSRVMTIGQVHHQLSESNSLSEINVDQYLRGLLTQLWEGLIPESSAREIDLIVEPATMASADKLPRLGIAATELVMNALKHGDGRVRVAVFRGPENLILEVSDEGRGFDADFDPEQGRRSLGLRLVRSLARDGLFQIHPHNRTAVRISL